MEALPPETRTVGQLVAETIRLYGRRFWRTLPLGLGVAALNQLALGRSLDVQTVLLLAAAPVWTASFIAGCALAAGRRPSFRATLTAFAVGVLVFLPVPLLVRLFLLPAVAWLAYAGLAVPVALLEHRGLRDSLRQAGRLARADYVHSLGSLATLLIVYFLSRTALLLLLHGQADAALRTAAFLADLVLSPLLFLGAALLYFDQAARFELRASGAVAESG